MFVSDAGRNLMQILQGQGQELGKGTIPVDDTQYCSVRAMLGASGETNLTLTAAQIDRADDATPDPRRISTLLHDADELMAKNPFEAGISLDDF